jgi:hypothetical protein
MKNSIIFSILIVLAVVFFNFSFINNTAAGIIYGGDCPDKCSSTIVITSGQANCTSGVWSGPGGIGGTFTTDALGKFYMPCCCEGTYNFCVGCGSGPHGSLFVNGSATVYNYTLPQTGCIE